MPSGEARIGFGQSHAGLEMSRDRFFGHLLPGDVNAEGLESVGLGMPVGQREQLLIGIARHGSGVGGKGAFEFNGAVPVGPEFGFRFLKCILSGQTRHRIAWVTLS